MKKLLTIIIASAVLYLLFAFCHLTFDFRTWPFEDRCLFAEAELLYLTVIAIFVTSKKEL